MQEETINLERNKDWLLSWVIISKQNAIYSEHMMLTDAGLEKKWLCLARLRQIEKEESRYGG